MAATATEQPGTECTWGGVCKGVAQIGLVMLVGVGMWYGTAAALTLAGYDATANTMLVIAGIPTAIAGFLGGLVGLVPSGGAPAAAGAASAAISTVSPAVAFGAGVATGVAGTAAVAYAASPKTDRGEPQGKWTQREQLREAAYAEALGENVPSRG